MNDESQLAKAADRALRTQELLDNELLTEAFRTLEDNYASAWRFTAIDDAQGREKLFLAINVVGKVRDHLTPPLPMAGWRRPNSLSSRGVQSEGSGSGFFDVGELGGATTRGSRLTSSSLFVLVGPGLSAVCSSMTSVTAAIPKRLAEIAVLALALCCSFDFGLAQPSDIAVKPKAVPSLDDFVQIPVPRGNFKAWCGRKDRFLIGFDGQLEAYDGNSKVVIPTMIPFATELQCDEDGRQLAYVSKRVGRAVKVDIESGASEILAEFTPPHLHRTLGSEAYDDVVSISPNFRLIATNAELTSGRDVVLIRLPSPGRIREVRWSADSSKLFYILRGDDGYRVEVLDTSQRKIGSGALPKKSWFRDGWFAADGESVLLYLGGTNESGPGFLVGCRIADWKCTRLRSNITDISVGGRGRIGIVSPYQVKPDPSDYADGTIPIHPKYLAEVLDAQSRVVARQVVLTAGPHLRRWHKLLVSPSGTRVVLTWDVDKHGDCVPPNWDATCIEARMFDLSRGAR